MRHEFLAVTASLCAIAGTGFAFAAGNDPADAGAPVPATTYRSPFTDYRVLGEDKTKPWIEANDTVRVIGGWKAYAKEAADARKAASEKPATSPQSNSPTPAAPPAATPPGPASTPHKHGG